MPNAQNCPTNIPLVIKIARHIANFSSLGVLHPQCPQKFAPEHNDLHESRESFRQGYNFNIIVEGLCLCPAKMRSINCELAMVFFVIFYAQSVELAPVSFLSEMQCTTMFALRNGKFSRLGGG